MTLTPAILFSVILLIIPHKGEVVDSLSYQEVISCEGVAKQTLHESLSTAMYSIYDSASVNIVNENTINIKVDITVANSIVGKVGNPAGELDFTIDVDVKDEKFRYRAYDFYFTPMERNRYGRFELKGKKEAVIEEEFKKRKALLKKIKSQSEEYLSDLAARLKSEVINEKDNETTEW